MSLPLGMWNELSFHGGKYGSLVAEAAGHRACLSPRQEPLREMPFEGPGSVQHSDFPAGNCSLGPELLEGQVK